MAWIFILCSLNDWSLAKYFLHGLQNNEASFVWALRMWRLNELFRENFFPHSEQEKLKPDFSSWIFAWFVKEDLSRNLLSHWMHVNGFWSVWLCLCLFRAPFLWNVFSQIEHVGTSTFKWAYCSWYASSLFFFSVCQQYLQKYTTPSCLDLLWRFMSPTYANTWSHCGHG